MFTAPLWQVYPALFILQNIFISIRPSSYRPHIGKANASCEKASGGVMIAATVKIATMDSFRQFLNVSSLTIPSIAEITIRTGNCDTTAKAIVIFNKKDV